MELGRFPYELRRKIIKAAAGAASNLGRSHLMLVSVEFHVVVAPLHWAVSRSLHPALSLQTY